MSSRKDYPGSDSLNEVQDFEHVSTFHRFREKGVQSNISTSWGADPDDACPFCDPSADRVFHEDDLVFARWDGFPISPGHALVITKRHVARWWDTTAEEREAMFRAAELARAEIEKKFSPDGYNIGFNDGAAAGQTVFHLHLHVVPRYEGDVDNPRGGVRGVIPCKADYRSD